MIDINNINELTQFFLDNKKLTAAELALLLDISVSKIHVLKKQCGVSKPDPFAHCKDKLKYPKRIEVEPVTDPEIWDNKEWFEQELKKYGSKVIARRINRTALYVEKKIKEYKIDKKTLKKFRQSDCKDPEWLAFHYYDRKNYLKWCKKNKVKPIKKGGLGLNQTDCSKLAGVTQRTILKWLVKFKFKIRTKAESKSLSERKNPRSLSIKEKREKRKKFFEAYRRGDTYLLMKNRKFSNGKPMGSPKNLDKSNSL